MKPLILCGLLLVSISQSISCSAKEPHQNKKTSNVAIATIKRDSYGTIIDGTSKEGAWDWSNWEEVVSDCKLYVFRTRMISKK